jgi:hypothetical protein
VASSISVFISVKMVLFCFRIVINNPVLQFYVLVIYTKFQRRPFSGSMQYSFVVVL